MVKHYMDDSSKYISSFCKIYCNNKILIDLISDIRKDYKERIIDTYKIGKSLKKMIISEDFFKKVSEKELQTYECEPEFYLSDWEDKNFQSLLKRYWILRLFLKSPIYLKYIMFELEDDIIVDRVRYIRCPNIFYREGLNFDDYEGFESISWILLSKAKNIANDINSYIKDISIDDIIINRLK